MLLKWWYRLPANMPAAAAMSANEARGPAEAITDSAACRILARAVHWRAQQVSAGKRGPLCGGDIGSARRG
ncbi:hypothetical protein MCNS_19300 [Mycobacterium conspicuum]|uniref:Uncharacterized protein n=1 Tax=Mycobacterium conspicuum TaxID=44010 RepID=A0A7I7YBE0_9MYCO|nr:hypothetical protein MCNS_19300 [Mycobacterium conspicuum]